MLRHICVSLKDGEGHDVFSLSDVDPFEDTRYLNQIREYFLAGVLDGLPDAQEIVPTINSYKCLIGVTYGYDSCVASIRIILPPSVLPSAARLEICVPGADMNPYFALSAIFQLGIQGIAKQLELMMPFISTYQSDLARKKEVVLLPCLLEDTTKVIMQPDSIACELFVYDFVDHFRETRKHEVRLWNAAVTNWEVERYLELA
ncbi:hypothetical protein F4604DRAFT_1878657 [Suillus subluteus]|nr:hypothetical protein F4604DRAFT_1878657 [Suillus subluteus]